ncbi:hypothetical protein [Mycolicibacterium fortuitum]|uniref:hypothetical protein n=1 Tax=Mycolicibacterium fortuitum TaxID=1766 RepID=UPI00116A9F02|nr:hypothetical protein [Mycolicibacterium fortuitum]TPW90276.1 hypothetical protein FKW78_31395 [Mycolicibacterium fortuitum]
MQSPGSWGPQQYQQYAPAPPPKKGGALKWVLGGTALIAVIAITAVVSMSLGGGDKDKGDGSRLTATAGSGSNSEFASANDTGPITIITEDPSCAAWAPINNTLADSQKNGWIDRDPSIPASAWSPDLQRQYQQVADALRAATDQTEPLAKLTTHRVMRQLYEQFIAYARAYTDSIPTYTERDNALVQTTLSVGNVLTDVCQAISFGSAAARAPFVPEADAPTNVATPGDPANPKRFLATPNAVCPDWTAEADRFRADTAAWKNTDPNIPAAEWSPEQKALNDAVIPVLRQSADSLEELGEHSDNPTFQDFAQLAAQYRRAYAQAIPTYSVADRHLQRVGVISVGMVTSACEAAGES